MMVVFFGFAEIQMVIILLDIGRHPKTEFTITKSTLHYYGTGSALPYYESNIILLIF